MFKEVSMGGIAAMLYGGIVYLLFFGTFLYAIAFVGNLAVPKTIDSGPEGALFPALIIDTLLLGLFAIQHSDMARPGFKRWWTRFVPQAVERTTYVLLASLALVLLFWLWRPILMPVWSVTNPTAIMAIQTVFWAGFGLVLLSTFLLNHFELFGLRQVWARLRGRTLPEPEFRTPFLYKRVRHPLYLGFVLAFWAAPSMTAGHLLFAVATTGYILIGIWFEERDMIALFGDRYRRYREQVPMLFPLPGRKVDAPRVEPRRPQQPAE
jgi:protein-S-isoprenylcysteine O-methyltransferase Ste14